MSTPTLEEDRLVPPTDDASPVAPRDGSDAPAPTDASAEGERLVPVGLTVVAAGLATAAAGWMTAGMFEGLLPRFVGLLGPLVGAGLMGLSYRMRTPAVVQYLVAPVLVLVGALLVVPDATGGSANLPGLVAEAVREGGLSQPPVAFAPGWRFILVVLTGLLAAGSAGLSISLNRPKVGLLLPVPFIFATALAQPPEATALSSIVALGLAIAAMSVAFGADLAQEGATSGTFESRRLIRGALVLVAVGAALFGLSQLGFLFPDVQEEEIVEPRRPEVPPPSPDRELFTATMPAELPVRLGVLDVYGIEENAWLTPPFRRSRLAEVPADGEVPLLGNDDPDSATILEPPLGEDGETFTATFTISDVPGRSVPSIQNALDAEVAGGDTSLEYDPRTQTFRVTESRARAGTSYTITAPTPPDARQLIAAPPPPERMAEYLEAPEPPVAVEELLAGAPNENLFDRLQFVRNAFYSAVVASGAGEPVDLPPSRVVEMLEGGTGTPYEITAAEVLLARWAGVPSRVGYGYYAGEAVEGRANTYSFRPVHGAMWLEAYFEGHGWIPILGVPPKAQASISEDEQREDPSVTATDELALLVYVPIKLDTIQLLFELVRFWLYRLAPAGLAAALALAFYPALVKRARRARRRRWARSMGPAERVAVAYTELRDLANDYNFGDVQHTPLEFLQDLAPDAEHRELAWLVTRALWGDLARDLRTEDAEAAEEMAASVARRLRRANGGLPLLIALASRASLRDPWTREIPNLWPARTLGDRLRALGRTLSRRVARFTAGFDLRRLRRRAATTITTLILSLLLGACAQPVNLTSTGEPVLPERIVPQNLGEYRFAREASIEDAFARDNSLVDAGRVYSIHDGPVVQGSLQVGAFKSGLRDRERDVRDGVVKSIGGGQFRLTRLGSERIYVLEQREQWLYMWFPPDAQYYELLAVRKEFDTADELFLDILAFQRGEGPVDPDLLVDAPDSRRHLNQ